VKAITVRDAKAGDLGRLIELYDELAEGDPARTPGDAASVRPTMGQILTDSDHHLCVASVSGTVVGAAEMIVVPSLTHRGRPWAMIENIIVDGSTRGNGVGTRLLEHLLAIARARLLQGSTALWQAAHRCSPAVSAARFSVRGRWLQAVLRRNADGHRTVNGDLAIRAPGSRLLTFC
jgi:GNAT superfamily N-acetyltransferase